MKGTNYPFLEVKNSPGEQVRIDKHVNQPSVRIKELGWQKSGLQFMASGYGGAIPTRYMVQVFDNKWRRLYSTIYSNVGITWIIYKGRRVLINMSA